MAIAPNLMAVRSSGRNEPASELVARWGRFRPFVGPVHQRDSRRSDGGRESEKEHASDELSQHRRHSLSEQLNRLGLIALTAGEETADLGPRLLLVGGAADSSQIFGAGLRGNERGEISELFDLQCGQLITCLRRLQCAYRGLAC